MTMVLIVYSGYRMTSLNILMIGKQMQRTEGVLSQKKQRDMMLLTSETRTGLRLTGRCYLSQRKLHKHMGYHAGNIYSRFFPLE